MDQAASRFNQQVAFVNLDNLSCLVLVEASFDQRILYFALSLFYLDLWYLAFFQRRSNRFRQRLNSDIYLVVPVRRLAFDVFCCLLYSFPVNHYWRARNYLQALIVDYPVFPDFQVQFPESCNEILASLFIYADCDSWVLLCNILAGFN